MIKTFIAFLYSLTKSAALAAVLVLALLFAATAVARYAYTPPLHSSIVKVLSQDGQGGGTGWSTLTPSGVRVIVTNHHVCQVAVDNLIRIEQDTGYPSIKRVLRTDPTRDLCVIEGVDSPTLTIADRDPARFEQLHVMGHPLLKPTAPSYGVYTGRGLFNFYEIPAADGTCEEGTSKSQVDTFFGAMSLCLRVEELSTSTILIAPGNSGSPVMNADNEVVGVINSAASDSAGMFVPLVYLKEILADE